jgi:hypothetical protein
MYKQDLEYELKMVNEEIERVKRVKDTKVGSLYDEKYKERLDFADKELGSKN